MEWEKETGGCPLFQDHSDVQKHEGYSLSKESFMKALVPIVGRVTK
jgi:hypothetical protein